MKKHCRWEPESSEDESNNTKSVSIPNRDKGLKKDGILAQVNNQRFETPESEPRSHSYLMKGRAARILESQESRSKLSLTATAPW